MKLKLSKMRRMPISARKHRQLFNALAKSRVAIQPVLDFARKFGDAELTNYVSNIGVLALSATAHLRDRYDSASKAKHETPKTKSKSA